jgi:hypothetical protein
MYTLIDPPVSPYSPPEKISAWVDELRGWRKLPEFQDPENRERLEDALSEAENWLKGGRGAASGLRQPPDRPAV